MTYRERADALIERLGAGVGDDREEAADQHLDLINERLDETGLRGKVWCSMQYACKNAHWTLIELEVGVEGPSDWREDGTYLACSFGGPLCGECGQPTTHMNWHQDETFAPRAPITKQWFRVPRERVRYPAKGLDEEGFPIYTTGDSAFLCVNLAAFGSKGGSI